MNEADEAPALKKMRGPCGECAELCKAETNFVREAGRGVSADAERKP